MKKHILTQDQLIISLASDGDATAFYSLVSPHLERKYLHLRGSGSTHQHATETVLSEASNLFGKLRGTHPEDFDDWYANHSDHLKSHDEEAEFSIEKGISIDRSKFIRELQLKLLRQGSSDRKRQRLVKIKSVINKPVIRKSLLFLFATTVLLGGIYLYLNSTHSFISILFNNSQNEYSLSIPLNARAQFDSIQNAKIALTKTTVAKDSLVDTLKKEEKVVAAPAPAPVEVKKPIIKPKRVEQSEYGNAPTFSTPQSASTPSSQTERAVQESPVQPTGMQTIESINNSTNP